jgi:hypothetical protein
VRRTVTGADRLDTIRRDILDAGRRIVRVLRKPRPLVRGGTCVRMQEGFVLLGVVNAENGGRAPASRLGLLLTTRPLVLMVNAYVGVGRLLSWLGLLRIVRYLGQPLGEQVLTFCAAIGVRDDKGLERAEVVIVEPVLDIGM